MNNTEHRVCEFAHDFVVTNWHNIDLEETVIEETKEELSALCKISLETSMWVLIEVASWGMDRNYMDDYNVELADDDDFLIFNINGMYIKLKYIGIEYDEMFKYTAEMVEPKFKTVIYFD